MSYPHPWGSATLLINTEQSQHNPAGRSWGWGEQRAQETNFWELSVGHTAVASYHQLDAALRPPIYQLVLGSLFLSVCPMQGGKRLLLQVRLWGLCTKAASSLSPEKVF